MKPWLCALGEWLDARLSLRATLLPMLNHPVPRSLEGAKGWWYVFGSASLTLFMIQIITGIGLALVYVPAAGRVPILGPWIAELLLGGPVIGGNSLSRFFTLHVFVIPALLLIFMVPIACWLAATHT